MYKLRKEWSLTYMMKHRIFSYLCLLLLPALFLCACRDDGNPSSPTPSTTDINQTPSESASSEILDSEVPVAAGTRDNTPVVCVGSADGTTVYENDLVTLDASHSDDGYVMVCYRGTNEKVKLQ